MVRIYCLPSAVCTCDTCPPLVRVRQCPLSILGGGAGPRSQISWRTSSSPTPAPGTVQYSTVQYITVPYSTSSIPTPSTGDCASSTLS